MFFIGYLAALLCLSFAPVKEKPLRGLELVLKNEAFQEVVFSADLVGIEKYLFQFALSQTTEKNSLNPTLLSEGIHRLVPGMSAIAFIDKLLQAEDPKSQASAARKIVEDGLFRKLHVRGADAPKATEISLSWAQNHIQRHDLSALREERQALLERAESLLRRDLRRAQE